MLNFREELEEIIEVKSIPYQEEAERIFNRTLKALREIEAVGIKNMRTLDFSYTESNFVTVTINRQGIIYAKTYKDHKTAKKVFKSIKDILKKSYSDKELSCKEETIVSIKF